MYVERDGNIGRSGVIAIAKELNRRAIRTRGKPFRTATVHIILHRATLAGTHYCNQTDPRTHRRRPPEEWIGADINARFDDRHSQGGWR
jgi:Recombinase